MQPNIKLFSKRIDGKLKITAVDFEQKEGVSSLCRFELMLHLEHVQMRSLFLHRSLSQNSLPKLFSSMCIHNRAVLTQSAQVTVTRQADPPPKKDKFISNILESKFIRCLVFVGICKSRALVIIHQKNQTCRAFNIIFY